MAEATPAIKINLALAAAMIACVAAAWSGMSNVYRAGQAVQAFDGRVTTIEATLAQGDKDRADRRAALAANMGAMGTRIGIVEEAARAANNAADRLTARTAAVEATIANTNAQMARFSEALADLSKAQAVTNALLSEIKDQLKGMKQ